MSMLEYRISAPDGVEDGAPVIVLLHGRGSDMNDLQGLRAGLPARAILVTPQAPFSGAQWGYGGGWAWYRFLGGTTPEPGTFVEGQSALHDFMTKLSEILPVKPGPIAIGGFSQGGTSSLAFALRNPGAVAGALVFSGFLASHPSVHAENAAGLQVFWGHGAVDQMIPFSTGRAGREALAAAGAELTTGDYQIGHWIDERELADAAEWLERLFSGAQEA
jgi:phospholipase/carboxylesterase